MGKKTPFYKLRIEQLIAVAALAISVVFLLAFGGQIIEIYRLRSSLAAADQRVESLRAEQVALEATRVYVESDEYAEKVAREELNKIRPGDRRTIIVPQAAPTPTPLPAAAGGQGSDMPSYAAEWRELLFGK